MLYKLLLHKSVEKFLRSHPEVARRFKQATQLLRQDPYNQNLDIKKLRGTNNRFRLRIGKYRFLFTLYEEEILVYFYRASSRGDVY